MSDGSTLAPQRRATSYDVAMLAGVSQSAVSRCFRDGPGVSADSRGRIEAASRTLGYAPNKMARSLITRRSHIVAVLVAETSIRSFPELLLRLGAEIQNASCRMLVLTVSPAQGPAAALSDILAYHVDGVISGVSLPDSMLQVCAASRIPVVLYNRSSPHGWASSVGCDDPAALAVLAAHLAEGGSRVVDFIAGPADAPVSRSRLTAMRQAAMSHGLTLRRVVHVPYGHDAGRAAAGALLAEGPRADTLVCANDALALGAMDACRHDHGLAVPGDVAVAGYDDLPEGAWPTYGLTTLAQPLPALAYAAMRGITEQLDGSTGAGEQRLMPARLIVRSSTRPTPRPTPQRTSE